MKAEHIHPQTFLELKPERQAAYGLSNPYVYVDEVRPNRHGYKRPWVYGRPCPYSEHETGAFMPSDFRRALGSVEAGQVHDPAMTPGAERG